MDYSTAPSDSVAIVGMAALFPGARDLATYWANLEAGFDAINDAPGHRWDQNAYVPTGTVPSPTNIYCRRGGFVDGLATFDTHRFGIMPNTIDAIEPDQLIALGVAADALADAGLDMKRIERRRTGIILGRGGYLSSGMARYVQRVTISRQLAYTLGELMPGLDRHQLEDIRDAFVARLGAHSTDAAIGLIPNLAASRIANRLDLRGPAYTIDAACASSLVAVEQAVRLLQARTCDVMLAGGTHHCHDTTLWQVFSQLGALSPSQRIRPFHAQADGLLIGEGTGIVVLRRLGDALRHGDRIYAIIRGGAVSSDGKVASLVSPDRVGQVEAMRTAWKEAGIDPRSAHSVDFLEAHGTATPMGDATELASIREVFGLATIPHAVLGSVKSMIGHAMPAAGAASLIKLALSMHHGRIPPTLHCDAPHAALDGMPFEITARSRPWSVPEGRPVRRGAVNAFGFGGINAHLVLESLPLHDSRKHSSPALPSGRPAREYVLIVSANDRDLLLARIDDAAPGMPSADDGRGCCRLAIAAPTPDRLRRARQLVASGSTCRGHHGFWYSPAPLLRDGEANRIAFVFPGLEARFEPRVADVAEYFRLDPPQLATIREDDVPALSRGSMDVGQLLYKSLLRLGVVPGALAGHSIGEWTALAAAGVFGDVRQIQRRLDDATFNFPDLPYAVIGADHAAVLAAIDHAPWRGHLRISHDNAPGQCVVCGPYDLLDAFIRSRIASAVPAQMLPFRSGFHTPMFAPYTQQLALTFGITELHPTDIDIWSATTGALYPAHAPEVIDLFERHLVEPVRFTGLIEAMHAAGYRAFVTLGGGQLAAIVGSILRRRPHLAVAANVSQRTGLDQLQRVLVSLWAEGAALAPSQLVQSGEHGHNANRVPLNLGATTVSLGEDGGRIRESLNVAGTETFPADLPLAADFLASVRAATQDVMRVLERDKARVAVAERTITVELPVSVSLMPYLLDHCLVRQASTCDEVSDLWPVVPATTLLQHMIDTVEANFPGRRIQRVAECRFRKWLTAEPALNVSITLRTRADDTVHVSVGSFAEATLAFDLDAPVPATRWISHAPGTGRACLEDASDLYEDRWMFHGPYFRGIHTLLAIGKDYVSATLVAMTAPGATLDNVGQLLGYWIVATQPERNTVFPVDAASIRFFRDPPVPGTLIHCDIRHIAVGHTHIGADVQLSIAGEVWVEIEGWRDRRFDTPASSREAMHFPERHRFSTRHGEWSLMREFTRDPASRELLVRKALGRIEREHYARLPTLRQKQWLLGRLAAKDAVRQLLWDHGEGPVHFAEIAIVNEPSGRPVAVGMHGRALPPLNISIAHSGDYAVAMAVMAIGGEPGAGIDIQAIGPLDQATIEVALSAAERPLLDALAAGSQEQQALWFHRFWAAKESVAKADGRGLQGRPRNLLVTGATATTIDIQWTIGDTTGMQQVRHVLHGGDDASEPLLVVAWLSHESIKEASR